MRNGVGVRVDTVFVSFYYKSADTLGSEWRRVVTFTGDSGLLVPGFCVGGCGC